MSPLFLKIKQAFPSGILFWTLLQFGDLHIFHTHSCESLPNQHTLYVASSYKATLLRVKLSLCTHTGPAIYSQRRRMLVKEQHVV